MNYFASNIKILRANKNRTQDDVAVELVVSRSTINSYENGAVKNPTCEALLKFSDYYKIYVDVLIRIDLNQFNSYDLLQIHNSFTEFQKLFIKK